MIKAIKIARTTLSALLFFVGLYLVASFPILGIAVALTGLTELIHSVLRLVKEGQHRATLVKYTVKSN